jgi:SAM-dependent methyltransferase
VKGATGFTNVDASRLATELLTYLRRQAELHAGARREDYDRLRLQPGAAVLDVGCGAGEVCLELAERVGPAGRVCGVDPSVAMLAAAQTSAAAAGRRAELLAASIYALPFADGAFDAVRAERVFQHLEDPALGLREMIRVTRPGGQVMIIDTDHGSTRLLSGDDSLQRVFAVLIGALVGRMPNPRIGARLAATIAEAGLAAVDEIVRWREVRLDDYTPRWYVRGVLSAAIDAGEISAVEAESFLAALEAPDGAALRVATVSSSVLGGRP